MNEVRHSVVPHRLALITLAAPLLLSLSACTEVNRFLAKAEGKPPMGVDPASQVAQEATPEPIPAPQEKAKPGKLYEWTGDGRKISRIVVNTDEQKARFYDGEEQVGWTTVASGVSKFPTPTGHFEVMEKVASKRSNLYGKIYGPGGKVLRSDAKAGRDPVPNGARFEGARMPYFLRLTNDGIGLHAGPIPRPGRPASHGCIRMPNKLAPVLFEHVDLGTQVSIVGSGPSYGNYVQKQRALAARERERREAAARAQAIAAAASPAPDAGSSAEPDAADAAAEPTASLTPSSPTEPVSVPQMPLAASTTPPEPAPQSEAPSDPQSADAGNASEPTPAGTPLAQPAAASTTPPPSATALGSPVVPTPPYVPAMRPAVATVPAPAAVPPVPVTAPAPVDNPSAPPPEATPSATTPAAPVAPPAMSSEPPKDRAEPSEG